MKERTCRPYRSQNHNKVKKIVLPGGEQARREPNSGHFPTGDQGMYFSPVTAKRSNLPEMPIQAEDEQYLPLKKVIKSKKLGLQKNKFSHPNLVVGH